MFSRYRRDKNDLAIDFVNIRGYIQLFCNGSAKFEGFPTLMKSNVTLITTD
jgi:hypothetical protein